MFLLLCSSLIFTWAVRLLKAFPYWIPLDVKGKFCGYVKFPDVVNLPFQPTNCSYKTKLKYNTQREAKSNNKLMYKKKLWFSEYIVKFLENHKIIFNLVSQQSFERFICITWHTQQNVNCTFHHKYQLKLHQNILKCLITKITEFNFDFPIQSRWHLNEFVSLWTKL